MAQLQLMTLTGPVVVGALSGGGEVIQLNRLERKTTQGLPDNVIMDNIGLITDLGVGGAALVNHLLPQPVLRQGSEATMGAGVAILVRRGTDVIGRNLLGLNRVVTRNPARNRGRQLGAPSANGAFPVYSPNAAIESPVMARKRQFFSVT